MTTHKGVHPRIGATDVIPFVPLENVSMDECVALARHVGQQLWDRYRIPVYFYEAAASRPERANLENVRKGQFEGLLKDTLIDPDRSPDIGEPRLHPTAGITAVGARKILIAYNIYLNTSDVSVAREIARVIRFSNGGLRYVKAIGVEMKTRHLAQVSINLTDFEQTPLHHVFDAVKEEAEKRGSRLLAARSLVWYRAERSSFPQATICNWKIFRSIAFSKIVWRRLQASCPCLLRFWQFPARPSVQSRNPCAKPFNLFPNESWH